MTQVYGLHNSESKLVHAKDESQVFLNFIDNLIWEKLPILNF